MKIVFFSDVHIGHKSVERTTLSLRFITDYCEDADMVCVVGDLFEFYHGYDDYIYPWYRSVVEALKGLASRGKRVFFLEGNHEFSMGKYFEGYTGVNCAKELSVDIDGKKIFVAHGDMFSRYSMARFLKRPFFYRIMDALGPALTWNIAMLVHPFLSRRKKGSDERVRDTYRSFALMKFSEGYDVVILAHSHIPDVYEVDGTPCGKLYLNTGDLVACRSFVSYETASGFLLRSYGQTTGR